MEPSQIGAEDFRGMEDMVLLCEGARVLLTQNLWVEAGLMNGALGYVRGFMFPQNFDPSSKELSFWEVPDYTCFLWLHPTSVFNPRATEYPA